MKNNENKIKYGLKNVHVTPITAIVTSGENVGYTYGTPFAVPGAVSLTANSKFSSAAFHADDTEYAQLYSNTGYDIDLEVARLVDDFCEKILGEENGVESADTKPTPFALSFEFDGDKTKTRFIFWHCEIKSKPSVESKTKEENPSPVTEKLTASAKPRETDGKIKARITPDMEVYDTLFTSIPEPSAIKPKEESEEPKEESEVG